MGKASFQYRNVRMEDVEGSDWWEAVRRLREAAEVLGRKPGPGAAARAADEKRVLRKLESEAKVVARERLRGEGVVI